MKWWFFLISCWLGILLTSGRIAARETLPAFQDPARISFSTRSADPPAWTITELPAAPMLAGSQRVPGGSALLQAFEERFGPSGCFLYSPLPAPSATFLPDRLSHLYPSHNFW